ncbi:unnamed protein product [Linum tenue]|uniref:Protein kinase domain-containing protein n=1 Tax=Linum tenue TaxID=586396 RepID=A0AAV0REY4_9ROSI|nr:unnamed protein product [Linum tenue]
MKADQTRTTTAIRGTKGYLAPEWFRNVPVTAKVDVHSFGIVLLELVCCRKNFLLDFDKEEEMVLVDWAYDCYSRGKLYKLVEKDVEAMEDLKKVERFVKVALWCIQEDPSLRPGMKKVVHMLEGAVPVSEPPDPNSFIQLESATGGFKEVLGRGASATVYKGILQNVGETITIAVKKEGEDDNREFTTEVKVIAGTNHKNLVKLVGVCSEGKNHLLVYEYMSNGSLASLLFKADPRPNWYTRAQIAISVARGLVYLHEECSTQIIHCDIKPQNILLDESLTAKISDFGLAKLLKVEQTRTMTAIRGTKGYVAPEWFRNMAITTKVDVYSFGVVLLELVCCRRGFEMEGYEEEEMVLVDWAHECYGDRMVGRLVEKDEEAMKDLVKVERFVKIGLWCVQEDPCLRPEMKKVVHMLEGAVEVSVPPSPASYINTV